MDREQVLIGADVGATTIAAGLVTERGEVVGFERVPTHGRGKGTAVGALLDLLNALLRRASRADRAASAIGIGLPGIVDAGKGMMVSDQNLVPEFAGVPLAGDLRASTGLPVFVENDVNALAVGEHEFGIGRGVASMVMLAVGTGVGGAIVLGGELVRGHGGCAGEFGHVSIDFQGLPCRCGGRGCLNDYVAGEILARTAREAVARGESSKVLALAGGDPDRITAPLVFEAAAAGDGPAMAIVERACEALGAGIAGIVNTLNPELVVVAGGVAGSFAALEDRVVESTRRYALSQALAGTRVCFVPADKRRTVLGGAAIALSRLRIADRPGGSGVPTGDEPRTTGRR
jgi:glucokinase